MIRVNDLITDPWPVFNDFGVQHCSTQHDFNTVNCKNSFRANLLVVDCILITNLMHWLLFIH